MMGKKSAAANLLKLAADPDASFDLEVGRLAKRHLNKIKSLTAGVAHEDLEAVHEMRVATRRIRALTRLKPQQRGASCSTKGWLRPSGPKIDALQMIDKAF